MVIEHHDLETRIRFPQLLGGLSTIFPGDPWEEDRDVSAVTFTSVDLGDGLALQIGEVGVVEFSGKVLHRTVDGSDDDDLGLRLSQFLLPIDGFRPVS